MRDGSGPRKLKWTQEGSARRRRGEGPSRPRRGNLLLRILTKSWDSGGEAQQCSAISVAKGHKRLPLGQGGTLQTFFFGRTIVCTG